MSVVKTIAKNDSIIIYYQSGAVTGKISAAEWIIQLINKADIKTDRIVLHRSGISKEINPIDLTIKDMLIELDRWKAERVTISVIYMDRPVIINVDLRYYLVSTCCMKDRVDYRASRMLAHKTGLVAGR